MQARRVVTGHDTNGKAIVLSDEVVVGPPEMAPGIEGMPLWTTEGFPASNDGDKDTKDEVAGITKPNGSVFTLVTFGPGCTELPHRTSSIDYGIILSGEIDMALEDGGQVHFKAGDVYVQRGTMHTWINHGSQPCVITVSIIDSKPVEAGGKILEATL
jgi:quercetin dioxygenase-like cupin family protein